MNTDVQFESHWYTVYRHQHYVAACDLDVWFSCCLLGRIFKIRGDPNSGALGTEIHVEPRLNVFGTPHYRRDFGPAG